jgi:hypothetical protein
MRRGLGLLLAITVPAAAGCGGRGALRHTFHAGPGAMAVVSIAVSDDCSAPPPRRVAAWSVWLDGERSLEILMFPASGLDRYQSLLGPFTEGRHTVELQPSDLWAPVACIAPGRLEVAVHSAGSQDHPMLSRAPVLELRADTIGEESDLPLYAYAERLEEEHGTAWRYSVVFSNEDGGTPTRALLARWGRTTDIEQVYEIGTSGGRTTREVFQGPDHATRAFSGRRQGEAPVLLVATLNNMVIDRGRSLAAVRPVPALADLRGATRESTMDERPWAYRVMQRELAAEGRIAADAPLEEQWPRVAPDPRAHLYLEAKLRLDRAVAVAWVTDRAGRRLWSHYGRMPLAIDRNGWVRTAVAVGPEAATWAAEMGWACLPEPEAEKGGSCEIEATRAFGLTDALAPGANLAAAGRFVLKTGGEATLALAPR